MLKDLFRNYFYPSAVLAGGIIGVGYLALPYVALQVGIVPMAVYFAVLTALTITLYLIFAKISLKTPDRKRLPGFVGYYFGEKAKKFILYLTVISAFGVLLVYLLVGSSFLRSLLSPVFGGGLTAYFLLAFAVLSFIVYFDVKVVSRVEFWALFSFLVLLTLVSGRGLPQVKISNFPLFGESFFSDWKTAFLPYGVILFSLWGGALIPEVEEMLIGRKGLLKKVVVISTLAPLALYLFFIFLVLGVSGFQTTDSALIGLQQFINGGFFNLVLLTGIITTFSAFVVWALLLKKTFMFDMGIEKNIAWALTCFVPLMLFLIGLKDFIPIVSFVGGIFLGINGIFILLIYRKIGGKPYVAYSLAAIFVLGVIYEIIYFIS